MSLRIAIPYPSSDTVYNERSFSPYLDSLKSAGALPVEIPYSLTPNELSLLLSTTHGLLLPGSKFDVDPSRYSELRNPACGPSDPARSSLEDALLRDAFRRKKPILAICHGMQSLNVWCSGKLHQDLHTEVVHRAEREVIEAHPVSIIPGSRLAAIAAPAGGLFQSVNSTHHQAVSLPGEMLKVVAVSPVDMVIEAVETVEENHFVLGVQWHPERIYEHSRFARSIFRRFLDESNRWSGSAWATGDLND